MVVALMLHYIKKKSKPNLGSLPYEDFSDLIAFLQWAENNHLICSKTEFFEELNSNFSSKQKKIILTFDDGYKEQYDAYKKIKETFDIFSIFFVTQMGLNQNLLLVNKIQFFIAKCRINFSEVNCRLESLILNECAISKDCLLVFKKSIYSQKNASYDSFDIIFFKRTLQKFLKHENSIFCLKILEQEFLSNVDFNEDVANFYMTPSDCDVIENLGGMVGFHTYNHPHLTTLSKERISSEIALPYSWRWSNCFCYPYGDFNDEISSEVKKAQYEYAFSTQHGICDVNSDKFALPRIDINEKWNLKDYLIKN